MNISTRGRYALRVLIYLAENGEKGFIPLKNIAADQEISQKYLEQILPVLHRNGLICAVHGKGGGYRLSRDPADYRVSDILAVTEKDFAPVACLEKATADCPRKGICKTRRMWETYMDLTLKFFGQISLDDLVRQKVLFGADA